MESNLNTTPFEKNNTFWGGFVLGSTITLGVYIFAKQYGFPLWNYLVKKESKQDNLKKDNLK